MAQNKKKCISFYVDERQQNKLMADTLKSRSVRIVNGKLIPCVRTHIMRTLKLN